jgi:arsenate reductase
MPPLSWRSAEEHWDFPDPSAVTGSEEERLAAFRSVGDSIAQRIDTFLSQDSVSSV